MSGIDFPQDGVTVHARRDKQGRPTFEARLAYRGPLGSPSAPKVRFDLTQHEPLLDGVGRRAVFHAYSDALPADTAVATYTVDELMAEKLRALIERTRPRDLYDVVFILENRPEALNLERVRILLKEKCGVKQLPMPTARSLGDLVAASDELRSEWGNMLAHQLPELPPIEAVLARTPGLFLWIDGPPAVPSPALPAVQVGAGQELVASAGLQYWGTGVGLEAVRFAGANRLHVEFTYNGTRRLVEPYSLRRAGTGNVLLYGWEQGSTHIKAFDTARMVGVRATSVPFSPRYRIEFAAAGPIAAPLAVTPARSSGAALTGLYRPTSVSRVTRRRSTSRYGPVYVYECTVCGRHFPKRTQSTVLRPHKDRGGYSQCPGQRGYLVDTRYP